MALFSNAATLQSCNLIRSVSLDPPRCPSFGSLPHQPLPHRLSAGSRRLSTFSQRRITPLVHAKRQTFTSFDDLLEKSDKPVLVDFYATWCGPCQIMVPVLQEVSEAMKDKIQVVKIDTEKYTQIADRYRIAALPTFILFRDGKPFDRFEGAMPAAQLIQRIENAIGVAK